MRNVLSLLCVLSLLLGVAVPAPAWAAGGAAVKQKGPGVVKRLRGKISDFSDRHAGKILAGSVGTVLAARVIETTANGMPLKTAAAVATILAMGTGFYHAVKFIGKQLDPGNW